MRNLTRTLALLLLCSVAFATIQAQELTKEETKYWKGKAKEYRRNLPALKALVESRDNAEDQVVQLQQEANSLRTDLALKDRQIAGYEEQLAALNQRVIAAEAGAVAANPSQPTPTVNQPTVTQPTVVSNTGTVPSISGTVFRIQIAALQQKKIDRGLATGNSMILLEDRNGNQKVMVGEFRTYANARVLRDRLRQIGVSGAFVQAFQDGQPIDIKTAVQYTGEKVD